MQFLHCIDQFNGVGGENEFVDGFAVAEHIQQQYPKEWNILTTVKCPFSDIGYDDESGTTFYKIRHIPTIR